MASKVNVDPNTIFKGVEMVSNLSKVAANLSEKKDEKVVKEGDNNQPHSQTVEVKVGHTDGQPKPVVVHEKKETHIHKPFPDSRNLTTEECDVERLRIQLDFDDKASERAFRLDIDRLDREERREREEYARKERERRREEDRKQTRRLLIGTGIFGACLVGLAAYGVYSDSRRAAGSRLALPKPELKVSINPVEAEGTVK